jgi:hypothetical protein
VAWELAAPQELPDALRPEPALAAGPQEAPPLWALELPDALARSPEELLPVVQAAEPERSKSALDPGLEQ